MINLGVPYSGCEYQSIIPCTREDEALAIAAGMWLCGIDDVQVFMQDAGFLSALNTYIGLLMTYQIKLYTIWIHGITTPEHHRLTGNLMQDIRETIRTYDTT